MSRSPLDRMVDEACGVPAGWRPDKVTLRCPSCRKEKIVARHVTDPAEAVTVETCCPVCDNGGKAGPRYFDGRGQEVAFHD